MDKLEDAMTQDDLFPLLANVLGVDPGLLSDKAKMGDTEKWDSIRQIMIMSELERRYSFKLSSKEMVQAVSVQGIRKLLAARGVA
jgi:acyl carrier protein